MDNLKKNQKFLSNVKSAIEAAKLLDNAHTGNINGVLKELDKLIKSVNDNLKILKDNFRTIVKAFDNDQNITYPTIITGSNHTLDLKTRGSYRIVPEAGVASLWPSGRETTQPFFLPFLGASIYARPIKKNIPYRFMDHSQLQRLSLNLGVSVIAIEDRNGEFSDLYNSLSLISGLNYKLFRGGGLSAGAMWIRQKDANPLLDETSIVPRFYFGVTFDLDYINAVNKITGKFGI